MKRFLYGASILLTAFYISADATYAKQDEKPKPVLKKQSEEDKQFAKRKKPFANRPILSIEFRGNTHISSERLREKMDYQKAGEVYEKERLEVALDRLRIFAYADDGYLQARFGTPEIEDSSDGLKITIPVLEGFRYRIGYIKIEDAKLLSSAEVLQILGLKTGDVARGYNLIQKGIESLIRYYKERGYAHFNVDFSPEFLEGSPATNEAIVDITFVLEEGAVYSIGKIKFKGNIAVNETLLRSNLPIQEGDLYKQSLLEKSIYNLNDLGMFELIRDEDFENHFNETTKQVDIIIHLKEKL